MDHGRVNPAITLASQGIKGVAHVYYNLLEPDLMNHALTGGEGELGLGGTLLVNTGKFTGRSPKDKHVVRTPSVEAHVWWDNNAPMTPEGFGSLKTDMFAHLKGRTAHVQNLFAGADPAHRLDVRVVTELAWHGLFMRHLLRRPTGPSLMTSGPISPSSTARALPLILHGTAAGQKRSSPSTLTKSWC